MNRRAIFLQLILFATSAALAAQNQSEPKFEVASVKPAGPQHDGPYVYRDDPEHITYERIILLSLIQRAYFSPTAGSHHTLDFDQIIGPAWLGTQFYSIDAKLPPGTAKEQLILMWRDLLTQRFHLKVHFATKEFTVYELTVGKNGPKFKKSGEEPQTQQPGFPVPPPGAKRAMSFALPRNIRQTFRGASIGDLVDQLRWPLSEQSGQAYANTTTLGKVIDKTGLDGSYDFTFEYAGTPSPGGAHPPPLPDGQADTAPYLFDALQAQLGLKLEEKKERQNITQKSKTGCARHRPRR